VGMSCKAERSELDMKSMSGSDNAADRPTAAVEKLGGGDELQGGTKRIGHEVHERK